MLSLNKTVQAGHVAKVTTGEKHARIRLGINERFKDSNGDWQTKSIFLDAVTFKPNHIKLAKEHITVGVHLYIEGKLGTSSFDKDGQTHYSTDLIIEELQFVGPKQTD